MTIASRDAKIFIGSHAHLWFGISIANMARTRERVGLKHCIMSCKSCCLCLQHGGGDFVENLCVSCNVDAHQSCVAEYLLNDYRACPVCKCKLSPPSLVAALELAKDTVERNTGADSPEACHWDLLTAMAHSEAKNIDKSDAMLQIIAHGPSAANSFTKIAARIELARNNVYQRRFDEAMASLNPLLRSLAKSKRLSRMQAVVQICLLIADAFHDQGKPMQASPYLKMAYRKGMRRMRDIAPIPILERLARNCALHGWHEKSLFYRQVVADMMRRQRFEPSLQLVANARHAIAEAGRPLGVVCRAPFNC